MILCSSRTICNGYKWKEIWFSLDIRKKLFSMRKQVAREVVGVLGSTQGQGVEKCGLDEGVPGLE